MRTANYVMAVLFLFGAAVQYNDPDPLGWMAIYVAAAVACVIAARNARHYWLPGALVLACILWAAMLVPAVVGRIPFLEMFSAWEMKNAGIEQSREMYGLLIIGGWMLVLAVRAIMNRRRSGGSNRNFPARSKS